MTLKTTPLDVAELLEDEEDICAFLEETVREGAPEDFVRALGTAARKGHDGDRPAGGCYPREPVQVAFRRGQPGVFHRGESRPRAGAEADGCARLSGESIRPPGTRPGGVGLARSGLRVWLGGFEQRLREIGEFLPRDAVMAYRVLP